MRYSTPEGRILRTPKSRNHGKENVAVSAHRDGGYSKLHNFDSYPELLDEVCEKMEAFIDNRDESTIGINDVLSYGVWNVIGMPVHFSSILSGGGSTEITAYELSLALFPPKEVDLDDLSKRVISTSMTPWIKICTSTISNSGAGLFALRTFSRDQVISVYCGNVIKGEASH